MLGISPDGQRVGFAYDAPGRRIRKEFAGAITEYVWDGYDLVHVRVTRGDDIDPVVTWLFEPGTFAPAAKFEGKQRYAVVTDHLGTPSALYTEAGELAWKAQLDLGGFGQLLDLCSVKTSEIVEDDGLTGLAPREPCGHKRNKIGFSCPGR